jgi:hypothetical protein
MGCREFDPGIERFCAKPSDFVSAGQIIQMATFFGLGGLELKKVKQLARKEEESRSNTRSAELEVAATHETQAD